MMVAHPGEFGRTGRLRARPFAHRAREKADLFADGHDDRPIAVHLKDGCRECGRRPRRMLRKCEAGRQ